MQNQYDMFLQKNDEQINKVALFDINNWLAID